MLRLVIVDDETAMRRLLNNVLDWKELNIEIAGSFSDGQSALDFIEKNKVDIVLADIKMSPMTGLELADQVSSMHPDICIIVMSAYRDFEYAREALKYHVHDYILKPITYDEFFKVFSKISQQLLPEKSNAPQDNNSYTVPIIEQAVKYIDEHCHEQLTRTDVARHVSLSSEYFSRLFHSHTNETFSSYLKKVRIERAKHLLKTTNLKVKEISAMCGIKKERYFSSLFKEHTGLSPQEYKKTASAENNTVN